MTSIVAGGVLVRIAAAAGHASGQLLMVEQTRGRTQERGGPLLEMQPGSRGTRERARSTGTAPDQDTVQLPI